LKLDYIVTGSWSLKAAQEATRLIGAKNVNIALDARTANNGKFGNFDSVISGLINSPCRINLRVSPILDT
jgi:phosphoserine aminotransferase